MSIDLPISKSIANRLLMLQAMHRDPLMEVSCDMPDDVCLIHDVLSHLSSLTSHLSPATYHLENCGTALRFLTAYCAQMEGLEVVLDGSERLRERPIGQEVEALRECGARIEYMDKEGFAPLHIHGTQLRVPDDGLRIDNPLSTQMVSALLLIGLPVQTNSTSPYIAMTKSLIASYSSPTSKNALLPTTYYLLPIEADWSAASYWYEYIALHGGEVQLNGLRRDSLQGDSVVADLFRALGVDTFYNDAGVRIARTRGVNLWPKVVDFSACPDLYPAVRMTYLQLGKPLIAVGTAALRLKESDRLAALSPFTFHHSPLSSHHDHRIAMALLAADLPSDDTDCVSKSYPHFVEALRMKNEELGIHFSTIVPKRGINDDNKGKKHALNKLVSAATTPYVWLQDDDITPPVTSHHSPLNLPPADLYILPLRMQGGDTLLEKLQVAEYAAIQEVTMRTAKRGEAVLCSGANMIVNREQWLKSWPDLQEQIPSGDDMFLLESFRRRGLRIMAVDRADFTATVQAVSTLRGLLRQRMRWAGKAPHYTDRAIIRYGAVVLLVNLMQLLCPLVLIIKFPIEYSLIKKRDPEVSFGVALILEILYPYYILLSLLGGLLRRSW